MRLVPGAASLGAALLGIALLASGPLAGQDDRARFSQHLGAVYAARTLSVIEAGVRDGLPRGLLIDKAMEGVAKGMAPEVVLEAVDTFAGELRDAVSVVGPRAEPIALEKAADALRRGVGRGLLTRLGRERAGDFPLLIVSIEELLDAGVELRLAEGSRRLCRVRGVRQRRRASPAGQRETGRARVRGAGGILLVHRHRARMCPRDADAGLPDAGACRCGSLGGRTAACPRGDSAPSVAREFPGHDTGGIALATLPPAAV